MYRLCIIHKPVEDPNDAQPFRPILSAIGTCPFILAKFFVPLFKVYTNNECNIKDLFSFSTEVSDEQDSDLYKASFDIQSLVTTILFV